MKTMVKSARIRFAAFAATAAVMMGSTLSAQAQSDAGQGSAAVPAIPSAPQKSYTPVAVLAMPGLKCKLHAQGGKASDGLNVYSDDDGYVRFHATRANPGAPPSKA